MSADPVFFVVPDSVDDPQRVSGGNVYDRRVRDGLQRTGWDVRLTAVPEAPDATARVLAELPDGALTLIDGLLVTREPAAVAANAARLRLTITLNTDETVLSRLITDIAAAEAEITA